MSNLKIDPTLQENYEAEARKFAAEAAREELNLARDKEKDAFDQSQDYRHGVISFAAEVSDDTVLQLSSTIRRMARMRPGKPIEILLNSPGGSIIDGFQAVDDIRYVSEKMGCKITMTVRGQACSMAAVLLQAADVRQIGANAHIMLHRASFQAKGSAAEVEDALEETKMLEQAIYNLLSKRSGKTAAWWRKKLDQRKDIWWNAQDAVDVGLVDCIA